MATIQQSIEIRVPVHAAYNQLTQFEDYPQFMEDVNAVQQLDDTHLHWTTVMSNRPVEWDAEITEQEPDRCIAWHNTSGPTNSGKVEVQPAGDGASRVTITLHAEPEQVPGSPAGNSEQEMSQRLSQDLARLKNFIEGKGPETGAWRGEVHDAQVTTRGRDAGGQSAVDASRIAGQETGPVAELGADRGTGREGDNHIGQGVDQVAVLGTDEGTGRTSGESAGQQPGTPPSSQKMPVATSAYAAGSEGWSGDENPSEPVTSASRVAAEQRNDSAGSVSARRPASSSAATLNSPQTHHTTQSDNSLSQSSDDADGRFSVAEEVNFDQQSDAIRHVGQLPQDGSADAIAKTMQQASQGEKDDAKLQQSMKRAVPPSE